MKPSLKQCNDKDCKNEFKPFKTTDKFCSWECFKKNQKPRKAKKKYVIPQISKKRRVEKLKYDADRIVFLEKMENRICPVTGKRTTEIHHKKTRIGKMFLDQKYWLAVSREGHIYIHKNDKWSRKNGYLISKFEKQK